MNKPNFKEKIRNLEAEVRLLKRAFVIEPNFDVDEANWQKIKPMLKKARAKLFKQFYA